MDVSGQLSLVVSQSYEPNSPMRLSNIVMTPPSLAVNVN